MLVFGRKDGERIVITHGGNIVAEVVWCGVKRGTPRIGVEADDRYGVHRYETWLKIKEERDGKNFSQRD